MKDFKTKQQMTAGHYCWGGKAMKKAEGGYAEGGMQPKRAYNGEGVPPSYRRAMLDVENGDYLTPERLIELKMGQKEADDPAANKGQGPTRNNAYRMEYLRKQEDMKPSYMKKTKRYSSDEPPYASSSNPPHFPEQMGLKRGGSISKPKLASDKKKYSDRDMQGIISQAKQMAPKIIQANQARAAQAQAAAGAQRPPLGGAMPARPPMGAMPTGAMPAMKKGGKLKLRRKG